MRTTNTPTALCVSMLVYNLPTLSHLSGNLGSCISIKQPNNLHRESVETNFNTNLQSIKMAHRHTTTTTTTTRRRHGLFSRRKVHHQKRKPSIGDKISGAMKKLKGTIMHRPGEKVGHSPFFPNNGKQ